MMNDKLRYLLLQVRNSDDPMREQEINCFRRVLLCNGHQITPWDFLASIPQASELDAHDVVLLGGSGEYSATSTDSWIEPLLDCLRTLHHASKPTFASCWGFQAMARAMGGEVIKDLQCAELGTHWLHLTEAACEDPVFAPWVKYSAPRWDTKIACRVCRQMPFDWHPATWWKTRPTVFRTNPFIALSSTRN